LERPVDVTVVHVAVVNRCHACVVSTGPARRRRCAFGARARLDDLVTRRCVRHHVGEPADRDERGCGQPAVDSSQTSQCRIAGEVSSVAPHQWW
jgi:hypothetical protein